MSSKKSADTVAKADNSKKECAMECLSSLDLSEDQVAKLKAVKDECAQMECSITATKTMTDKLSEILTAEQFAKMKAECEEKGCWLSKEKAEEAAEGSEVTG